MATNSIFSPHIFVKLPIKYKYLIRVRVRYTRTTLIHNHNMD